MAGDHQTPGNDSALGDGDVTAANDDARVTGLIDGGLERYGAGDLDGALTEWERALALAPENARANEYVDYVRENYELLQQRLDVVRQMEGSPELEVPFGLESVDAADDDDAYDMVEVSTDASLADLQAQRAPTKKYIESVDEGWFLDVEDPSGEQSADELPPPPEAIDPGSAPVPEPPLDLFDDDGFPAGDTVGVDGELIGGPDLGFDLGDVGQGIDLDDPYDNLEFGDESEKTTEVTGKQMGFVRAASTGERESEDELTVPGGVEHETYATDGLGLSDDALRAMTKRGMPSLERPSSPDETTAERSGVAGRIRLDGLDELAAALSDDRALDDSGESPRLGNIEFRGDDTGEEELTTERPSGWVGQRSPGSLDYGESDADNELTRDRAAAGLVHEPYRPPTVDPSVASQPVIVDHGLLSGADDSADDIEATREHRAVRATAAAEFDREAETKDRRRGPLEEFAKQLEEPDESRTGPFGDLAVQLLIDADSDMPAGETDSDRVRRRLTRLLARADSEWQAGNHLTAVAAVDLALDEDPNTAIAQKLIHRNKDRVFEIYESYLGDLSRCPVLALPMHELAQQNIDNRAAFLLSRIDGTLSFDDVLDVSGMARLEAFRVIARMLIQGILEVR